MRTIQLAALAAVLGVTTVACKGKDSGTGTATTTGEGEGEGEGEGVGAISGTAGVLIAELGCSVIWDMSGDATNGADLLWDVDLAKNDGATTCSFGDNTSGSLEVAGGAAYFNGDYWGAAASGGGAVSWGTVGYVYGAAYSYVYSGSGTY